jgi:dTDP-4-amino-4,6-dideoxy-D-galactose acyltransferase
MSPVCELLPWDSELFGFQVARLRSADPTDRELDEAIAWGEQQDVTCMYARLDVAATRSAGAAVRRGFDLIDMRVTLTRAPAGRDDVSVPPDVRPAKPADADWLSVLAASAFVDSRFTLDTRFPRAGVAELYRRWIARDLQSGIALVLDAEGQPGGFVSGEIAGDSTARLGLIGVDARWRRRGFGTHLTRAFAAYVADRGATRVNVVTQARNLGALRLYEQCGFYTTAIELWLHRWFARHA